MVYRQSRTHLVDGKSLGNAVQWRALLAVATEAAYIEEITSNRQNSETIKCRMNPFQVTGRTPCSSFQTRRSETLHITIIIQ